jgi:hypothetical protein
MNTQTQPRYPQINSNTPKVWNYSLDLKHLGIPVNTVYKSVDPESQGEEYYIVNNNYRLVRQDDPSRGIDVGIARTLIRVS